MFTIVDYCEKLEQSITQPGTPDSVSIVCLMQDTFKWKKENKINSK